MNDTILIVDDEPGVIAALRRALIDEPLEVYTASSAVEGLAVLQDRRIKLVISDEKMPGMSGSDFLTAVKNLYPDTVRIMLTGHASANAAMKAVNEGEIYRFFAKPWNDVELKLAIRSGIEKFDLQEENRNLLKTVKHQASRLNELENAHPGITALEKDPEGNVILPEISPEDKELFDIMKKNKSGT